MKHRSSLRHTVLPAISLLAACVAMPVASATPATVPLAGNAFITRDAGGAVINEIGKQWARNASGTWSEVTAGRFTGDATATNGQRMDYAGGLENGKFYLHNGGFFADVVKTGQNFTRPATGQAPAVDVNALPLQ